MGTVINLNQARKKIAKQNKQKKASKNRAKFGQTKSTKTQVKKEKQIRKNQLDGHKIDESGEKGES